LDDQSQQSSSLCLVSQPITAYVVHITGQQSVARLAVASGDLMMLTVSCVCDWPAAITLTMPSEASVHTELTEIYKCGQNRDWQNTQFAIRCHQNHIVHMSLSAVYTNTTLCIYQHYSRIIKTIRITVNITHLLFLYYYFLFIYLFIIITNDTRAGR